MSYRIFSLLPDIVSRAAKKFLSQRVHKVKLTVLFLFPLSIFVITAFIQINKLSKSTEQLAQIEHLTKLSIQLSSFLHETQKERGLTGIYLTSKGSKFLLELNQQRQLTEQVRQQLIQHLFKNKPQYQSFNLGKQWYSFNRQLSKLPAFRDKISRLMVSENAAIAFFNKLNEQVLLLVNTIVKQAVDTELAPSFLAYINFIKAKEMTGQERAKLGVVFTRDTFLADEYTQLVTLEIKQAVYFQEFNHFASTSAQQAFAKLQLDEAFQQAKRLQQIAHQAVNSGDFGVSPLNWFNVISLKIEQLKLLEQQITAELLTKASALELAAKQQQWLWFATLLVLFLLVVIFGVYLIDDINHSVIKRMQEYQCLFEHSSAAMVVIDIKNRNFLYSNTRFAKLIGYSQQQISTLNILDLHKPEQQLLASELFKRLASGEISSIEKLLFIGKNQRSFFAEISAFPLLIGEQQYLAANVIDITKRLENKNKLQKSVQSLQMVLDSLAAAVVVVDPQSLLIIYKNKLASELYQCRDEIEALWLLLSPQVYKSGDFDCFNKETSFTEQHYDEKRNRWYQISTIFIQWYDGRLVFLRKLEDITEHYDALEKNKHLLTENRRLLQRNYRLQEKERKYLASELHDQLGQLLTGIKLQADFIYHQVNEQEQALQQSASSIIAATAQLIASTRSITNNLRPILLDQLGLSAAIQEQIHHWQQVKNTINFEFANENCPEKLSDEIAITLYRIVQEALNNACKYARAQNITIVLTTISASDDEKSLQLRIKDDGIGFEAENNHSHGMGLINMRERTEALGGSFRLINNKTGVEIIAAIPLVKIIRKELCKPN
jgi:PAS domain S-box-containing protein